MEQETACLSGGDFVNDWDQYKTTVGIAIKTARKIDMPDKLIEIPSVKVGNFLSERLCAESKEDALIKDLWGVTSFQERKILGVLIFRLMDKTSDTTASMQEKDEPYGGY
jgi:hypothetical protein